MRRLFSFLIWLLYLGNLRRRLNTLQRWIMREGREARLPLVKLETRAELRKHLQKFQYRLDGRKVSSFFIPLDYISAPEVFENRLQSNRLLDGDCDDYHHYAAVQLKRLGLEAWHVTIGYQGGGHVATVFREDGELYLLNYQTTTKIDSFEAAGDELLRWADRPRKRDGKSPARMRWLVFETTELERVYPSELELPVKPPAE